MTDLIGVQEAVAARLRACLSQADPVLDHVPSVPQSGGVYVSPADPWVTFDPDMPSGWSASVVADLLASTVDMVGAQKWLSERVAELLDGCADGVVVGGDVIVPVSVGRPEVFQAAEGATFLTVRVEWSRVGIGDC
jgi:hypothetical protein